jgi:hypothetical protein
MISVRRSTVLCLVVFTLAGPAFADDTQWVRPEKSDGLLVWGRHDGIVFGLPSKTDWGKPRGLIRVGIFPVGSKGPELLNYIAVEPVVAQPTAPNRKGFSELEPSQLDPGQQGKRLWIDTTKDQDAYRGEITTRMDGNAKVEVLSVPIEVEKFSANGAKVHLVASIESDRPNEVRFSVMADQDSAVVKELTLTATMGNFERLRLIWLKDRVLDSRTLAPDYKDKGFTADSEKYPASEMLRTAAGDPIVFATTNEPDPAAATAAGWHYRLPKLTQYWSVPQGDVQPDLRLRVNERDVYWKSDKPVFGGIAFENFELRQKYAPGQTFIFGISPKDPWDLDSGPVKLKPYSQDASSEPKANP